MKKRLKLQPLAIAALFIAGFFVSLLPSSVHAATYEIGDIGPAGGVIFYIDGNIHYEAAPSDLAGTYEWGCSDMNISGAEGTAIGTGEQNTLDIMAANCTTSEGGTPAGEAAASYSINSYDDWFLPSQGELNQLYLQKIAVGVASNVYQSSTESHTGGEGAWNQDFTDGGQYFGIGKDGNYYVRPIRSFDASIVSNAANTTVTATLASTISLTTSGTVNFSVTPTSSGVISSAQDTVSVSTNNSSGYSLSFSSDDDAILRHPDDAEIVTSFDTPAAPGTLSPTHWGFRVDGVAGFGLGPTSQETNVSSSAYTWAGVPTSSNPYEIKSTGAPATDDTTSIWYALNINTVWISGTYSDTVTYTAVTN